MGEGEDVPADCGPAGASIGSVRPRCRAIGRGGAATPRAARRHAAGGAGGRRDRLPGLDRGAGRPSRRARAGGGFAAPSHAARPVDTNPVLRLADGSTAAPLDPESQIDVVEDATSRVRLSLVRGRGRFEVVPRPQRAFVVRAGDVTVTVVGTVFTVERVADSVGVTVQRGTVRVDWKSGSTPLTAGQGGWFPPLVTAGASQPGRPVVRAVPHLHHQSRVRGQRARRGGGSAADLLLAADGARLSGHPDEGVELLRKLLRDQPRDPRAPLAAFTLGRLLLVELGHPAEAATAFAQARRIAPAGPFAEDALAREVEALSKAGMAAAGRPAPASTRGLPEWAAHRHGEDGWRNQVKATTAALPVVWLSLAAFAAAAAQDPASSSSGHVELEVRGCPAIPAADVRRIVGIEIGDLLLDASASGQQRDVDRLTIRCAGNFASVEATGSSAGGGHRANSPPGRFSRRRGTARPGVAGRRAACRAQRDRSCAYPGSPRVVAAPGVEKRRLPAVAARRRAPATHRGGRGLARVRRAGWPVSFGARAEASRPAMKRGLIGGDLEFVTAEKSEPDVGRTTAWLISGAATFDVLAGGPPVASRGRVGWPPRTCARVRHQRGSGRNHRQDIHPAVGRTDDVRQLVWNAGPVGSDGRRRSRLVAVVDRRGGRGCHGHSGPRPVGCRFGRRRPGR